MNEYEIAVKKVLPYINAKLHWTEQLVSSYGRVPVQVGGSTIWADFVYYISRNQKAIPWLLVEVKKAGIPLEQVIPQAESYSLILGAPFFCVTDGDEFDFYATGNSQGKSISLEGLPPIPSSQYLTAGVEYISFPSQIDDLIDLFLIGLKNEKRFLEDTKEHEENVKQLNKKIFRRVESLSAQELKLAIDKHMMMKLPNKNLIFSQIDDDFDKIKSVLRFISNLDGDPVNNINELMDKTGQYYLKGGGIFFITQLLAGAHPNEYVVLEENISKALRNLGITEILVKNDTANGYVYVNEICKKLFNEKLEDRLRDYGFGLSAVHNFLWHWYVSFRIKKEWGY